MCEKEKQRCQYIGIDQCIYNLRTVYNEGYPGIFTLSAGGWVGPTDNLDVLEKTQILGPCQELNRILQSSSCFTDWATLALTDAVLFFVTLNVTSALLFIFYTLRSPLYLKCVYFSLNTLLALNKCLSSCAERNALPGLPINHIIILAPALP